MLFRYEIKKIIQQRLFIFAFACCVLLIICLYIFVLQSNGYYDLNNTYKTGIKDAQELSKQRQMLNGKLEDEFARSVVKQFQSIVQKKSNFNEQGNLNMSFVGHTWQKYSPFFDVLMRTYSASQSSNGYALQKLKIQDIHANDILLARTQQLQSVKDMAQRNIPLFNKDEKNRIDDMRIATHIPMDYEDATGWNLLFSKLSIVNMSICVISLIIGSTLFSREVQTESAAIIYTTYKGRTKGIVYKYLASICVVGVITIFFQSLFAGMLLSTYSFSGMHTMIQFQATYWLSIFPFTNMQAYLFILVLGFVASMTMLCVSSLFSRYGKKDYIALIFSLLVLFLPMVCAHTVKISPYDMCNGNIQLLTIDFYRILSTSFLAYQIQLLVCVLIMGIWIILYRSFQKHHVIAILK